MELAQLFNRMTQTIPEIVNELSNRAAIRYTPHGVLLHVDNGSPVLGVVHLDTVLNWDIPGYDSVTDTVFGPQLDDRLGLWCILDLLPSLGIVSDILLTDSEETGNSTAQYFQPNKKYNWLYQFDRNGMKSALYQYHTDTLANTLESSGLPVEWGTYSDICMLSGLGCAGINIGTGYYNEHMHTCFARLSETRSQVQRFAAFYREHYAVKFPHNAKSAMCSTCEAVYPESLAHCPRC